MNKILKRKIEMIIDNAKRKGATEDEIFILKKADDLVEKFGLADLKVM